MFYKLVHINLLIKKLKSNFIR